jgi:protein-tyrosine-phosphatase
MAHAIFLAEVRRRSFSAAVYSAGVIDFSTAPPLAQTTATCLQFNTPSPKESPTWVGQLPLESIDRFLVMEHEHVTSLVNDYGVAPERISLLGAFDPHQRGVEIADPYAQGSLVHQRSYERIRDCIIGYLETTDDLR